MKIFSTLIILLLPFLLAAQINQTDAEGRRHGLWKKQYPNGRLMYEGCFRHGKPVGEWKRYHEGGQTKAVIVYAEDSDSAYAQLFNPHGKKIAEGNYLDKTKAGKWKFFSGEQKIAEEHYSQGLKHGISKTFYQSGELLQSTEWKEGIQEGKHQVFYKNGEPYMQCKYSRNQRNGLCLTYHQNGRVEMEANYKNNLRHDDWKFYDENGTHLYTLKYDDGKLLNPEVRDSIDNLHMNNLEKGRHTIPDPEKFMEDP
ncbi:MAG: toxin-antitoxin system YwqK family antitoxin [Prolixibacteraceae bacterium]